MDLEVPIQDGLVIKRPIQLNLLSENVSESSGYEMDEIVKCFLVIIFYKFKC